MSAIVYWLVIQLYTFAIRIASLFNNKARLFVAGRRGLLRKMRYALIDERRPRIWVHCASLGEFEQGLPVIEKLRADYSNHAIVVTFYSPSGYEVRKEHKAADYVFYLPIDNPINVRRFLNIVQPKLAIFVKYDFWYFYISAIARRDIPLILISGIFRPDQIFFKWYGYMYRRMLKCFSHIFVQDGDSQTLLERHGINDVTIAGDTRFDRVVAVAEKAESYEIAEYFCKGAKVLIAGSTWPKDEVLLADAFDKMDDDWKLIIAPHETDEEHVRDIEKLFDGESVLWSKGIGHADRKVLIVDKIGILKYLYRYADVAWIGGGFGSAGIHNVLEASVYGVPSVFGPIYYQFLEAKELVQNGGAVSVDHADALLNQIRTWNNDSYSYEQARKTAKQYVAAKAGATKKITDYLDAKNWLSK